MNKKYLLLVTKEHIKNGNIVRDILFVYETNSEEKIIEKLKGSVGTIAIGGRLNTLVLEKQERTEVYLYEDLGENCGDCIEYKTYIKKDNQESISDFFKTKEEKPIRTTLLVFYDYLDLF